MLEQSWRVTVCVFVLQPLVHYQCMGSILQLPVLVLGHPRFARIAGLF